MEPAPAAGSFVVARLKLLAVRKNNAADEGAHQT